MIESVKPLPHTITAKKQTKKKKAQNARFFYPPELNTFSGLSTFLIEIKEENLNCGARRKCRKQRKGEPGRRQGKQRGREEERERDSQRGQDAENSERLWIPTWPRECERNKQRLRFFFLLLPCSTHSSRSTRVYAYAYACDAWVYRIASQIHSQHPQHPQNVTQFSDLVEGHPSEIK